MAWQLHFTSAEAGPAGRAGFQFVAESPGLPPGLAGKVAAYLAYRPPPSAPLAPTAAQVAALPVALSYGPVGGLCVLTRCVYLGQDYSGRYGNYLGHAVVAEPEELTGLRPVEFWRAPLWADTPAPAGTPLPAPADLPPGDQVDPESLASWLASGGETAYARLGALLETVVTALARGHGRLVLVCADVEEIVRWIGAISYSLPWQVAARLPFCTYSADPATAPQLIVGTTPDVWMPSDVDAAVVRLDEPPAVRTAPLGRFARTVIDCWRHMDLAGIDAIAELGSATESGD
ncbi:GAP1-N2 domain-containing protein, partial [Sphaerisporangium melleum]